jgi:FAD/FMN-containing dehydrogenase
MTQYQLLTGDGVPVVIDDAAVEALGARLRGPLLRPGDPDYDAARAVWNGMIDRHPALIARCVCTEDVVAAVRFASDHALLVAVRGGGHNVAGSAVCDQGLVIDLSSMKAIQVDPMARTVRAQAGATWGDLDRATQAFGLATPGGLVSETGIAGLTLGGGIGWLRNMYGLSCDNLISAELVTADGQVRLVNASEHADLFWALRGGGGNFGVVTLFEYRLHPVGPEVALCFVLYPAAQARAALQFFRTYAAAAPDEISAIAVMGTVPHADAYPIETQGQRYIVFGACYAGPVEVGQQLLQPLREWSAPLLDFSGVMPYVDVQTLWDADYPAGKLRYYWKSIYVDELSDAVIDRLVRAASESPSHHATVDIWHMGGALGRIDAGASAFGRRDMPYLIGIEGNWEEPSDDMSNIAWTRTLWGDLQRFSSGAVYLNFPGFGEEGEALVRAGYGENYERLAALKRQYDPTNLFRMNQNILPEAGAAG